MNFIEPKAKLKSKVDWLVSDRAKHIVKYYAEFTGFPENEIVNEFLLNLVDDPKFKNWILSQRNNRRIISQISLAVEQEAK